MRVPEYEPKQRLPCAVNHQSHDETSEQIAEVMLADPYERYADPRDTPGRPNRARAGEQVSRAGAGRAATNAGRMANSLPDGLTVERNRDLRGRARHPQYRRALLCLA